MADSVSESLETSQIAEPLGLTAAIFTARRDCSGPAIAPATVAVGWSESASWASVAPFGARGSAVGCIRRCWEIQ